MEELAKALREALHAVEKEIAKSREIDAAHQEMFDQFERPLGA
jgi:hypothetical protein